MDLIKKIKEKKELKGINDKLVKEVLDNYLKSNNLRIPESEKGKKLIIKEVRSRLRKYVGRFQIKSSPTKRKKLLEQNKTHDLLKTHSSTKERLEHYTLLKNLISSINPRSILDLACGFNPIALAQPEIVYHASDIKEDDLEIVKKYFKLNNIKGTVSTLDIKKEKKFPKVDLTLLMKVLDIIETKSHKIAEKILKNLNTKHIIISFATHTLSGKPMRVPRRKWLENILKKLNYKFKIEEISNEIFYIATTQKA